MVRVQRTQEAEVWQRIELVHSARAQRRDRLPPDHPRAVENILSGIRQTDRQYVSTKQMGLCARGETAGRTTPEGLRSGRRARVPLAARGDQGLRSNRSRECREGKAAQGQITALTPVGPRVV